MSHIKPRILVTVELALLTIFFSIIIAIPIGSSRRSGRTRCWTIS